MNKCFDNQAWKAVHVLAGSIVESVLIDYLVAKNNVAQQARDPLKIDLAEAIDICKTEKVLSSRTADLCSVVRSYRNLIHPGRVVRLGEDAPNEASARIATSLVDLIVAEVARSRSDEFGFTAEQITSKLERDANCLPIVGHLLKEASVGERDRFFLEVLPMRFMELVEEFGPFPEEYQLSTLARLQRAYDVGRGIVGVDVLTRATQKYVRILKEADGNIVSNYELAFFKPSDIAYLAEPQRALVKEHLLSKLKPTPTESILSVLRGIEEYLEPSDASAWIDPMVRALTLPSTDGAAKNAVRNYLKFAAFVTAGAFDAAVQKRLDDWSAGFKRRDRPEDIALIEAVKVDLNLDLPF